MPNIYGDNFSATDKLKKAPGADHNAGVRRFSNSIDLAVEGGGTTNPVKICALVRDCVFDSITISSPANLSALTFTAGTAAAPAKYLAATAGPNNAIKQGMGVPAMRKMEPLSADEEVFLTPSAAWPGTGIVEVSVYASKR